MCLALVFFISTFLAIYKFDQRPFITSPSEHRHKSPSYQCRLRRCKEARQGGAHENDALLMNLNSIAHVNQSVRTEDITDNVELSESTSSQLDLKKLMLYLNLIYANLPKSMCLLEKLVCVSIHWKIHLLMPIARVRSKI